MCTSFVPFRSIDRKTKRHRNKIEREITVARYKSMGGMNRIRINTFRSCQDFQGGIPK